VDYVTAARARAEREGVEFLRPQSEVQAEKIAKASLTKEEMQALGLPGWLAPIERGMIEVAGGLTDPETFPYLMTPALGAKVAKPIGQAFVAQIGVQSAQDIAQGTKKIAEGDTEEGLQQLSRGAAGAALIGGPPLVAKALEPSPAVRLARELERAELTPPGITAPRPITTPADISMIPMEAEPFARPGIPELAGRALEEAQSRLEVPGRMPAIEQLRRELEPPSILEVEPTRVAERIPGGGEAPYGRVSFMREAEAPTAERTQRAIQQETAGVLRPLREPEITQKGAEQVPAAEGRAQVAEARIEPTALAAPTVAQFAAEFKKPAAEFRIRNTSTDPNIITTEKVGLGIKSVGDLNEILKLNNEGRAELAGLQKKLKGGTITPEEFKRYSELAGRIQYPREVIETATNIGGWAESAPGPGKLGTQLGERPMDWNKNPEVRQWLIDNANKIWTDESTRNAIVEEMRGVTEPIEPKAADKLDLGSGVVAQIDSATGQIYIKGPKGDRIAWVKTEAISPDIIGVVTSFIDEGYRGQGYVQKSIERLSELTGKTIVSDISPSTSARAMWERMGAKLENVPVGDEMQRRYVYKPKKKGGERIEKEKRQEEVLTETGAAQPAPDIISKLESFKFPETGEGRLYSLPHPDAIKAIGRSTWNTAIDLAIAAIKSGKTIVEAIETALSHIRKNAAGKFDEAQARANIEFLTKAETGAAAPTRIYPVEGESIAMRKSAERATTSEMFPEPVQEQIRTAPESFYRQQSMTRVEDTVSGMSEPELAGVPRDSNLYTAAKLEQSRRLFERGENEAGYNVFVELEKEGTRLGQLINQFKLLKGTRPEDIVRVINSTLKKAGKDVLTKTQQDHAIDIAKKSKDADGELAKATDAWRKDPSLENAKAAEEALLDATQKGLDLQRFIGKYQPRSVAGIIKSVLQGNLLTPISEVANIVGNISFLPFRALDRTVASTIDVLDSFLTGGKREITVQPIRGPIEAAKGLVRGAEKIPDIFLRGTGDVIKGETRAGLHPIKAWINQFSSNPELPTIGGKLTLRDRLGLAIEGTFGVPAEAMLRGLGAGDVAFRESAQARATATELRLANVPRDQWNFAQKFPELFLDESAMSRIHADTMQSVFQRSSSTLNWITKWIRGRGDWFDLAAATVAPYKLTPWNIVGEILSYNPLIAMGRSVYDFKAGNRRGAKLNAGKFVVGSMLTAAGWWLYKNGLMSPSLDQRDEAQKARILAGEVLPPNHINLSGLQRALSGGDPSFKKGDETADVFRAGGLAGSMFYMTANIGRQFERNPEASQNDILGSIIRQSTLEQARFGMNQSFLSGVEGLLGAIREGNTDNYVRQWMNTVASVPMPNSLTVLSRATREYKPDLREDAFKKQVENIVRNRLGFAKMDDYLPLKRGLWGEPLRETPKDRNALVYHFFDVFKNKQVTDDPVALELFKLWRETGDTRVIPSLPEKSLTIGENTYQLNAAQQSRYAELVGGARRRITDAITVNPQFQKLQNEQKIDLLDRVYRAGLDQGKAQFWQEIGGSSTLTLKPSRAGFKPAVQLPQPAVGRPQ
jgi:hypothetical protein